MEEDPVRTISTLPHVTRAFCGLKISHCSPGELHQRHLRQVITSFCKVINTVLPAVLQVGSEADTLSKQEDRNKQGKKPRSENTYLDERCDDNIN